MPSRRRLDPASRYIADAFDDAKRHHPDLTQGEFARRTFPVLTERGGAFARDKDRAAWEEREGSRLLGRILKGEASSEARALLNESYNVHGATVEFRDKAGKTVSYANFQMPLGFSTFDAFRVERSPSAREHARRIARGRLNDSPPFKNRGDRRAAPYVAAVRPIKIEQRRPFVGEFRAPTE